MTYVHNPDAKKFEAVADDGANAGYISYTVHDGNLYANHTFTTPEHRGKGVAAKMLDAMVAYARDKNVKIVPICSYVTATFEKHPDKYADVIGKRR